MFDPPLQHFGRAERRCEGLLRPCRRDGALAVGNGNTSPASRAVREVAIDEQVAAGRRCRDLVDTGRELAGFGLPRDSLGLYRRVGVVLRDQQVVDGKLPGRSHIARKGRRLVGDARVNQRNIGCNLVAHALDNARRLVDKLARIVQQISDGFVQVVAANPERQRRDGRRDGLGAPAWDHEPPGHAVGCGTFQPGRLDVLAARQVGRGAAVRLAVIRRQPDHPRQGPRVDLGVPRHADAGASARVDRLHVPARDAHDGRRDRLGAGHGRQHAVPRGVVVVVARIALDQRHGHAERQRVHAESRDLEQLRRVEVDLARPRDVIAQLQPQRVRRQGDDMGPHPAVVGQHLAHEGADLLGIRNRRKVHFRDQAAPAVGSLECGVVDRDSFLRFPLLGRVGIAGVDGVDRLVQPRIGLQAAAVGDDDVIVRDRQDCAARLARRQEPCAAHVGHVAAHGLDKLHQRLMRLVRDADLKPRLIARAQRPVRAGRLLVAEVGSSDDLA